MTIAPISTDHLKRGDMCFEESERVAMAALVFLFFDPAHHLFEQDMLSFSM